MKIQVSRTGSGGGIPPCAHRWQRYTVVVPIPTIRHPAAICRLCGLVVVLPPAR